MTRWVSEKPGVLPGGEIVEIIHCKSDPVRWIVRRRRNTFFGLRDISSTWFNSESEAEAFARAGGGVDDRRPRVGLDINC